MWVSDSQVLAGKHCGIWSLVKSTHVSALQIRNGHSSPSLPLTAARDKSPQLISWVGIVFSAVWCTLKRLRKLHYLNPPIHLSLSLCRKMWQGTQDRTKNLMVKHEWRERPDTSISSKHVTLMTSFLLTRSYFLEFFYFPIMPVRLESMYQHWALEGYLRSK